MGRELEMLQEGLKEHPADWVVVLTHFPAHGVINHLKDKPWAVDQIDVLFTGHAHLQKQYGNQAGMELIVSGGGGGVSSDTHPNLNGRDDSYGFVNFKVNRTHLHYEMHSWGGSHESEAPVAPIIMDQKILTKKNRKAADAVLDIEVVRV